MSVNFQAGFDQQRRVPHALSLHTLAGKGIESIFPVFSWSSGYNQCFGSGSAFISPPCRIQHDKMYPCFKIFLLAAIIKVTFQVQINYIISRLFTSKWIRIQMIKPIESGSVCRCISSKFADKSRILTEHSILRYYFLDLDPSFLSGYAFLFRIQE